MAGFTDLSRGITVNADIIEGGTRTNVIAERAREVLDLRATRIADMKRLERKLQSDGWPGRNVRRRIGCGCTARRGYVWWAGGPDAKCGDDFGCGWWVPRTSGLLVGL